MMRQPSQPPRKIAVVIETSFIIMTTIVNIVSYLMMTFGLFRGFYFAYISQDPKQFVWSVVMTVFAVYINLKNPNK